MILFSSLSTSSIFMPPMGVFGIVDCDVGDEQLEVEFPGDTEPGLLKWDPGEEYCEDDR